MTERKAAVTMKGNPLTLLGSEVQPGQKAPDFEVIDNELAPKTLADYAGKVLIISSVPSIDTEVCDKQTRTFNEQAASLGDTVRILTISMDLPFAQKRWCGANGIDRVIILSDFNTASFGQAYGTLIKELRLDTRAIFVIDKAGTIQYTQYVSEITNEPDYQKALDSAKNLV
jgi:thiol peroxidase